MSTLLPPNATPLTRALEAVAGDRLAAVDIERLRTLWTPADCPAALLPWLAWALSVDEWDTGWNEATQRAVIAASVEIHRLKGTLGAVRRALAATGYRTQIAEWWQVQPPAAAHTFQLDVEVDDRGIDADTLATVARSVDATKPARSHYTLRVLGTVRASTHRALATLSGERTEIQPYQLTDLLALPSARHVATGWQDAITTTVYPA